MIETLLDPVQYQTRRRRRRRFRRRCRYCCCRRLVIVFVFVNIKRNLISSLSRSLGQAFLNILLRFNARSNIS